MSEEYSLKRSFEVLKLPLEARAPIIQDEKGNIIDGVHRVKDGVECPRVQIPIKNPGQAHLIRLLINGCRRELTKEEKEQAVVAIAENYGLTTAKEIASVLPYGEDWVRRYLPSRFKNQAKARAAIIRHESAGQRPAPTLKEFAQAKESKEEFAKRFGENLESHINQLLKRDFGIFVSHVSKEGKCAECQMADSCPRFLEIVRMEKNLPQCMRNKLGKRAINH